MNRKVTIYDIAKEAGVSGCCVSWVLRNHPRSKGMNADTRQRILNAAAELGYVQNQLATATRTGQVNTIGVILNFAFGQDTAFVNKIVEGILVEASIRKHYIKIFSDDDLEASFRAIRENRINSVISTSVLAPVREKTAELAEKSGIQLVFCYERGHGKFPSVNADNEENTARAVHYLAGKGHTRIGLFCVPHWATYVDDRHNGYLRGMDECGLTVDPRWIRCSDAIEQSVKDMLSLPKQLRPTAFVALSDILAAEAQRAAWKRGLRIPEDFSIVGIGDTEGARAAMVPLTTFQENYFEAGNMLAKLALGVKLDIAPDGFNVYRTHPKIIERESVFNISKLNNQGRSK